MLKNPVEEKEIHQAMFGMKNNKAPSLMVSQLHFTKWIGMRSVLQYLIYLILRWVAGFNLTFGPIRASICIWIELKLSIFHFELNAGWL